MTEGPIVKALITMAVPIVMSNMLQTAYQLVDAFWVGRLGEQAVAAVSASFPVVFLLISLGGGLAVVGSAFVAQYAGARDYEAVNQVAGQTFLMVFAVALLLSVLGYLFVGPILDLMGIPAEIYELTHGFLSVSIIGVIFMFTYFIFESVLRGVGETRLPLMIVATTVLLNLVLDPLFIFGWGPVPAFGVKGAAYATIISQAVAAFTGMVVLMSNRFGIQITLANLKPDFPFMARALSIALPASVEQSSRAVGINAMNVLVISFGTTTMAAFGIGFRFLTFVIIPALGLSIATAALVGQNLGAGRPDRAEQVGSLAGRIAFFFLISVGAVFFIFARPLVTFFIPDDPSVIAEGSYFLRVVAFSFGFMGWQQVLLGVFRGAGSTVVTMFQAIISLWLIQFPLALFLSKFTVLGARGIWWAYPVSSVLTWLLTYVWYRRGGWKHRRLTTGQQFKTRVSEEIIAEEGL
jgi:putative MATE family efflux protein